LLLRIRVSGLAVQFIWVNWVQLVSLNVRARTSGAEDSATVVQDCGFGDLQTAGVFGQHGRPETCDAAAGDGDIGRSRDVHARSPEGSGNAEDCMSSTIERHTVGTDPQAVRRARQVLVECGISRQHSTTRHLDRG